LAPSSKLLDKEDVTEADDPTNEVIASIGGTINSRELDPEPQLI